MMLPAGLGESLALGTALAAPIVTVATVTPVPVHPDPVNLVYVTVPVTPVDGNPPTRVADRVVEVPTLIGDVAAVVSDVMLVLFTVTLAHVPVNTLLFASPLYDAS